MPLRFLPMASSPWIKRSSLDYRDQDMGASIRMNQEELLGEMEDILRTMPPRGTLHHPTDENFAWLGRVSAFIEAWDGPKSIPLGVAMNQLHSQMARDAQEGLRKILTLLHQARLCIKHGTTFCQLLAQSVSKSSDFMICVQFANHRV